MIIKVKLNNKWDSPKNTWKEWNNIVGPETGLGWDCEKKTIQVNVNWWDKKIKVFVIILLIFLLKHNKLLFCLGAKFDCSPSMFIKQQQQSLCEISQMEFREVVCRQLLLLPYDSRKTISNRLLAKKNMQKKIVTQTVITVRQNGRTTKDKRNKSIDINLE